MKYLLAAVAAVALCAACCMVCCEAEACVTDNCGIEKPAPETTEDN